MIPPTNSQQAAATLRSMRRSHSTGSISDTGYQSARSTSSAAFVSPPDRIAASLTAESENATNKSLSISASRLSTARGESPHSPQSRFRTLSTNQDLLRNEASVSRTLIADLNTKVERYKRTSAKHEQTIARQGQTIAALARSLNDLTRRVDFQARDIHYLQAAARAGRQTSGAVRADLDGVVEISAAHMDLARRHQERIVSLENAIRVFAAASHPSIVDERSVEDSRNRSLG